MTQSAETPSLKVSLEELQQVCMGYYLDCQDALIADRKQAEVDKFVADMGHADPARRDMAESALKRLPSEVELEEMHQRKVKASASLRSAYQLPDSLSLSTFQLVVGSLYIEAPDSNFPVEHVGQLEDLTFTGTRVPDYIGAVREVARLRQRQYRVCASIYRIGYSCISGSTDVSKLVNDLYSEDIAWHDLIVADHLLHQDNTAPITKRNIDLVYTPLLSE